MKKHSERKRSPRKSQSNPYGSKSCMEDLLSKTDIQVLGWYYYDGYSMAEIGTMLDRHKTSIRDRLDKCLRILLDNGLPTPKRLKERPLKRKINLSDDDNFLDEIAEHGERALSPLIVDKIHTE